MPSLTYAELADRLGITLASATKLARRKHWARAKGNDRLARVQVPDEARARAPDTAPPNTPAIAPPNAPDSPARTLIARLEGELVGMREALAEARTRADAAEARADKNTADLTAHVETLKAELGARSSELAAANARAGEEAAKTTQAIAAFEGLAQRLEAIAEARRPWWRWLVG